MEIFHLPSMHVRTRHSQAQVVSNRKLSQSNIAGNGGHDFKFSNGRVRDDQGFRFNNGYLIQKLKEKIEAALGSEKIRVCLDIFLSLLRWSAPSRKKL